MGIHSASGSHELKSKMAGEVMTVLMIAGGKRRSAIEIIVKEGKECYPYIQE
jgi:hypothetical protein